MDGKRFVDIKYMFEFFQLIKHQGLDCPFCYLKFTKKKSKLIFSTLCFTCKLCSSKENINSENPSDNLKIDVNMTVINTGQGYV